MAGNGDQGAVPRNAGPKPTIWKFGPYDYTEETSIDTIDRYDDERDEYDEAMLMHYHKHRSDSVPGLPEHVLVAYARTLDYPDGWRRGEAHTPRWTGLKKLKKLSEDEAGNLVSELFRVWLDEDTGDRRCAPRAITCGMRQAVAWETLDASLPPHMRLYQGIALSTPISADNGWGRSFDSYGATMVIGEPAMSAFFGTPACAFTMMNRLKFVERTYRNHMAKCVHCKGCTFDSNEPDEYLHEFQDEEEGHNGGHWVCGCPHVNPSILSYSTTALNINKCGELACHQFDKYFAVYPLLCGFENPRSFDDLSDTGAYLAIVAPGLHQSDADAKGERGSCPSKRQALRMFLLAVDAPGVTAVPGGYAVVGKNLLGLEQTFFAKADDSLEPKHPLATHFHERLLYVHHPQLGKEAAPHARLLDLTLTEGWAQYAAPPASAYKPRVTQTANGPETKPPARTVTGDLVTPPSWPRVEHQSNFVECIAPLLESPIFDDGALRRRLLECKLVDLAAQLDALHEVLQVLTVVPGGALFESRKRKYGEGGMASPSTEDAAAEGAEGGAEAQAEARAGDA